MSRPVVADGSSLGSADLTVNGSGAAVLTWDRLDGGLSSTWVTYRPSAGAAWTSRELAAWRIEVVRDLGIDDSGRAVLLYETTGTTSWRLRAHPARLALALPACRWEDPPPDRQ